MTERMEEKTNEKKEERKMNDGGNGKRKVIWTKEKRTERKNKEKETIFLLKGNAFGLKGYVALRRTYSQLLY
jgi:hypothetical protein